AREGIKELLSPSCPSLTNTTSEPEFDRWERCLELLVEEFLSRKQELLKLNKARREKIEAFLRERAKLDTTLQNAVQSRLGSPDHEALQLFAHQVCVFHLLQVLLLKRW